MINLFHIPDYKIDTSKFNNLLNGDIVNEFEQKFCNFVSAPHGVSLSSESAAIFLLFKYIIPGKTVKVPSMIPPVVPNHLINAGKDIIWTDNTEWVGDHYILYEDKDLLVIDSAQAVYKEQFKLLKDSKKTTIILYSLYPTKPISGCDGGMLVSNDETIVNRIRMYSMNGMSQKANSWERTQEMPGWKMYLNSMQAAFALKSLEKYHEKKRKLSEIKNYYNEAFGQNNKSYHLYTIDVNNSTQFISNMKEKGIVCGKHYYAQHLVPLYNFQFEGSRLKVEEKAKVTVSIPFHEKLTQAQLRKIKKAVNKYR